MGNITSGVYNCNGFAVSNKLKLDDIMSILCMHCMFLLPMSYSFKALYFTIVSICCYTCTYLSIQYDKKPNE